MAQRIESEKTLERSLKRYVEQEKKGWCLKLPAVHISGLPDRICLMPLGIIFFAEIKTTKKKPKALQLWVHRKLKKLGFKVHIVDSTEDIDTIKRNYDTNVI